jgi:hypothetical protein
MELEHTAVPGVGIEDELAVRESSVEVDGILAGHHLVALVVHDQHRLVDAREVRGLLLAPSVDCLELGAERAYGDGLVAVVRTFLQPCQELLAGSAPIGPGEEEELLGVLAGEQSSRGVSASVKRLITVLRSEARNGPRPSSTGRPRCFGCWWTLAWDWTGRRPRPG